MRRQPSLYMYKTGRSLTTVKIISIRTDDQVNCLDW